MVPAARSVLVEVDRFTPLAIKYCPAGIAPAGEMWSVVTESPTMTSTRAPTTSGMLRGGSAEKFWKKGGSCT